MLGTKERARLVGQKIVAARRRCGMSQVELSQRIAERYGREPESVRRSLVNNETGRYSPRLHMLEAIAEATGQPLSFFAVEDEGGDGPEGQPFRDAA